MSNLIKFKGPNPRGNCWGGRVWKFFFIMSGSIKLSYALQEHLPENHTLGDLHMQAFEPVPMQADAHVNSCGTKANKN